MKSPFTRRLAEVNKELWLLLSLFVIAAMLNYLVASDRMILGFYTLPTLFSAYFYGRRHATLTAFASVLVVILVVYFNPVLFREEARVRTPGERWFDITVWGGILVVIAYTMGTLFEHKEARLRELRETYHGILVVLQQFISKDKYTQNHSYRVSIYSAKIALTLVSMRNGSKTCVPLRYCMTSASWISAERSSIRQRGLPKKSLKRCSATWKGELKCSSR